MIKISKLSDYAIVILSDLNIRQGLSRTSEVAQRTAISEPTVSKVLKMLTKSNLVASTRGAAGGYQMTKSSDEISVNQIIRAIEGPITITNCTATSADEQDCSIYNICPISKGWNKVNIVLNNALSAITLNDLTNEEWIQGTKQ